jgi:hypothetical protein
MKSWYDKWQLEIIGLALGAGLISFIVVLAAILKHIGGE